MSYVILFCIIIGHMNVDSTAAVPNPYMQSRDGGQRQNQQISSDCKVCGQAFVGNNKLIVGGRIVQPTNKFPWVVAMTRTGRNDTGCAGAIINEYFILTAAHCILMNKKDDEEMQIIFLSTEADIKKGRRFPVAEFFPHPKFSFETGYMYDIGLLKMKEPIHCSEFANPICLPPQNYRHPIGSIMGVNGWGQTRNSERSDEHMEAQMWIVQEEKCKNIPPCYNAKDMKKYGYCLFGAPGKQSSCFGDSGGSMVTEMGNKYYTIGVTSLGDATQPDPCDTKVSGVAYSSVSAYMDWITEVTGIVPSDLGNSNATRHLRKRKGNKRRKARRRHHHP